jgi:hypothetical protein
LLWKKTRFLKQGYAFVFDGVGSTDARCNVGISKHIKGIDIYFGHKDKVYVISKQLIIDVFGVCAERYVEESKGQINKSLVVQVL